MVVVQESLNFYWIEGEKYDGGLQDEYQADLKQEQVQEEEAWEGV